MLAGNELPGYVIVVVNYFIRLDSVFNKIGRRKEETRDSLNKKKPATIILTKL